MTFYPIPAIDLMYYTVWGSWDWLVRNRELLEHVVLPLVVVFLATISMALIIQALLEGRRTKPTVANKYPETKRELPMSRGDRNEERLKTLIADIIGDAMEEAEFRGRITRSEKNNWYKRLGHSCGLSDLLPKRMRIIPDLKALKEELKTRLTREPKVPLPGSKQGVKQMKANAQKLLNSSKKSAKSAA